MDSAVTQPFTYKGHEPEHTLLYQVLASEWETRLAGRQADASRSPLPAYTLKEVEAYLRCGILDHGFLILACAGCAQPRPVAFSCKHRGICPSCCAKRGAEVSTIQGNDKILANLPSLLRRFVSVPCSGWL